MAHDVFISHSSKDKPIADAVCAKLEERGIRCWIAPRDIVAGVSYPKALIQGINESRLLVLVFSGNANGSDDVAKEVERACSKGLTVVPLRIEDVPMSEDLEYHLSATHWLDALTPPLEQHLAHLAETVGLLLERMAKAPAAATEMSRAPTPGAATSESLAERGEFEAALPLLRARERLCRESGERPGLAKALANHGWALVELGRHTEALPVLREAEVVCREVGDRTALKSCLGNLGWSLAELGEFGAALPVLREAEVVCREVGDRITWQYCAEKLAHIHGLRG